MAYAPPPQVPPRPGGGGLPGIGVLMLLQVLVQSAVLGSCLVRGGLGYLPDALGLSYAHPVPGPVGFAGADIASLLATAVLMCGAFAGGRWVRGAAVLLGAVNGYAALSQLVNLFGGDRPSREFAYRPVGNLLLTCTLVVTVLVAAATAVVVAATRAPAVPAAPPALFPPPGPPGYRPPYGPGPVPAPVPGPWGAAQPAPPAVPPPRPPADGHGAAYAYPPPPPVPPVS
ncbi:hypothetical protein [Kitasatospora sp. NPDC088783]|uniref:hypothetical protein n=1 Tax=Kitasatospora sp. NPDC088783 TaxID=3364077 RepID=UPI0037FF4BFE